MYDYSGEIYYKKHYGRTLKSTTNKEDEKRSTSLHVLVFQSCRGQPSKRVIFVESNIRNNVLLRSLCMFNNRRLIVLTFWQGGAGESMI